MCVCGGEICNNQNLVEDVENFIQANYTFINIKKVCVAKVQRASIII